MVAYALAGRVDIDLFNEPLGTGQDGRSVFLKDIWPSQQEIEDLVQTSVRPEMFQRQYSEVFTGDERWAALPVPESELFSVQLSEQLQAAGKVLLSERLSVAEREPAQ